MMEEEEKAATRFAKSIPGRFYCFNILDQDGEFKSVIIPIENTWKLREDAFKAGVEWHKSIPSLAIDKLSERMKDADWRIPEKDTWLIINAAVEKALEIFKASPSDKT